MRQKSAKSEVVKLVSVARLQCKDGTPKLRADIGVKGRQGGECIRLSAQRKSPHIAMNQLKRKRSNGGGIINRQTNMFADSTGMTSVILDLIATETETP